MMFFVDETGCDRRSSMRKFGYALKGKHDYITVCIFVTIFRYDISVHDIVHTAPHNNKKGPVADVLFKYKIYMCAYQYALHSDIMYCVCTILFRTACQECAFDVSWNKGVSCGIGWFC